MIWEKTKIRLNHVRNKLSLTVISLIILSYVRISYGNDLSVYKKCYRE